MAILDYINPFSNKFLGLVPDEKDVRNTTAHLNSYSTGEDPVDWRSYNRAVGNHGYIPPSNPYSTNNIVFDTVFANKRQRVNYYRNLALYPFVHKLLNIIANECVCRTHDGEMATFGIANAYKSEFKEVEYQTLKAEFDYVVNAVLHKDDIYDYFLRWLIDGELFLEICLNDKGDKIAGVKQMPPWCTICIWDDGMIDGFVQDPRLINIDTTEKPKQFTKDQIAYARWGEWGSNLNDSRGILERAIRPINQLRALEDALTVYYITRAPEKRIWNIYAGRLPGAQQEEFIHEVRAQIRKTNSYDPNLGMIVGGNNVQSLSEDIIFAKDKDGQQSTVESFKGSVDFATRKDDFTAFRKDAAEALMVPMSRWMEGPDNGAQYVQGVEGLTMEEANFQKCCRNWRRKFVQLIYQLFITQLKVRNFDKKYLDSNIYDIDLIPATDFENMRDLARAEKRGGVLGAIAQYLPTLANSKPDSEEMPPMISKQFAMEKWLGMTTDEILLNDKMLEREKQNILDAAAAVKEEGGETADEEADDMEF